MNNIQLSSEIRLEASHPLHAKKLHKAVTRNRKHLSQFLTWITSMTTVEDVENYLIKCANEQKNDIEISFNIFKSDNLIGRIGLYQIDKVNKNACIGYWIDKKEQGKGIITNAATILIDCAFQNLDLHRIEILTAIQNDKSTAIPIRLGFQKEGVLRGIEKHNDIFHDLNIFSLLKPEWKK